MKLLAVVCRVSDETDSDHLQNVDPAEFLDLLSEATSEPSPEDDLAALEAEIQRSRAPVATSAPVPTPAPPVPKASNGMIVLPRAAVEPLFSAKTRGELIEKLDELLSQFNARLAKEGEVL